MIRKWLIRKRQRQVPIVFEQARYAIALLQTLIDIHCLNHDFSKRDLSKWPWVAYHLATEELRTGSQARAIRCAELVLNMTKERIAQIDPQIASLVDPASDQG